MKKARARAASPTSNAYWDKKLLEVEAKDPNRWRHSGYKSLYIDGSPSSQGRRSQSRSPSPAAAGARRSSRSPIVRSTMGRRSPASRRSPRSPVARGRSPRSPAPRRRSPASPPSRRSPVSRRSPPGGYRSPAGRRSPIGRRTPAARRSPAAAQRRTARPRSPPPKSSSTTWRSASKSSISSCSDDSCSVCSPKNHHRRGARSRSRSFSVPKSRAKEHHSNRAPPEPKPRSRPARPPSPSPVPQRRAPKPSTPPPPRKIQRISSNERPTDPRRQPPPPRPRGRTGEVIDVTGVKPPPKQVKKPSSSKEKGKPVLLTRVKKEKKTRRPGSPGESSESEDDSSNGSVTHIVATTSLTLSERFGKIAQWSADRERREMENMRITKTGGDLKVMIEEDDFLYGSPPPRRYSLSPVPAGHYPDELLSSGQSRLAAWDDVRVRYQYYKDLGYLRDLTLEDYVKWEEWWYKYQDWLANERHYEHWARSQSSRRRRKRLPASQRLN
ncbi:serine/arginine repetitive matrix protein 2-like isoform X2 [Harmonia axyridis]|nr:serine/arginine repetitive matrix protein 2-like isoform X2 [Harmonia axyridis]XP_045460059.1 serine/arginine repetitive matrix protein 2-like isoform X2 [Harmonia axyridis]